MASRRRAGSAPAPDRYPAAPARARARPLRPQPAPQAPRRIGPPRIGRSNQCGTQRRRGNQAVCRRRNRPADTTRHPRRLPGPVAAARHGHARFWHARRHALLRGARKPVAQRAGTNQARRFRRAPLHQRGSCRHSSHPCPSAAGRGCRWRGCGQGPGRNARTGFRPSLAAPGAKNRSCFRRAQHGCLQEARLFIPAPAGRRSPRRSGRPR